VPPVSALWNAPARSANTSPFVRSGETQIPKASETARSTLACLGQPDSLASRLPTVARRSIKKIEEMIAVKPDAS
jgi:hypothetical protein